MNLSADNQFNNNRILQLKILVADDDVLNQRMMQLLLKRDGHLVDLASNGAEALEAVKIQEYDIVFMDLQMPLMDGIEASRRIREWENGGKHTFIVALTASYLPEEGQILFEAGIDNYISKPFEMEHIQQLLKYAFQTRIGNDLCQPEILEKEKQSENVLDIQRGIVQVGGDEDTYRELLEDFTKGLPKRLRAIQDFFASRDLVELSRAAHNLQGIAANLGAAELSGCVRKLDRYSAEGQAEHLDAMMQEIQFVVIRLLEISTNFLAEKKINMASL